MDDNSYENVYFFKYNEKDNIVNEQPKTNLNNIMVMIILFTILIISIGINIAQYLVKRRSAVHNTYYRGFFNKIQKWSKLKCIDKEIVIFHGSRLKKTTI